MKLSIFATETIRIMDKGARICFGEPSAIQGKNKAFLAYAPPAERNVEFRM